MCVLNISIHLFLRSENFIPQVGVPLSAFVKVVAYLKLSLHWTSTQQRAVLETRSISFGELRRTINTKSSVMTLEILYRLGRQMTERQSL